MNSTIQYYNNNKEAYVDLTVNVFPTEAWTVFESFLKDGDHILDAGCGAGRDSLYFLQQGYKVTSLDASKSMAEATEELTGQKVICQTFQNFNEYEKYDAIWCYASLLHLQQEEHEQVFQNFHNALKPNGILFMCFKHGENDGKDSLDRYFYDLNEDRFNAMNLESSGWSIEKQWIVECPMKQTPKRPDWYTVILRKTLNSLG